MKTKIKQTYYVLVSLVAFVITSCTTSAQKKVKDSDNIEKTESRDAQAQYQLAGSIRYSYEK